MLLLGVLFFLGTTGIWPEITFAKYWPLAPILFGLHFLICPCGPKNEMSCDDDCCYMDLDDMSEEEMEMLMKEAAMVEPMVQEKMPKKAVAKKATKKAPAKAVKVAAKSAKKKTAKKK
jgi:hypothetical protein